MKRLLVVLFLLFTVNMLSAKEPVKIGDKVDLSVLNDPDKVIHATIGGVSDDAKKKYKTFDEYIAARRRDSVTGKGFEVFFALDFNAKNDKQKLIPTAALGNPHDPTDLVLTDVRTGTVTRLIQCKIGQNATIDAANDPKYFGSDILVPSDTFDKIKDEYDRKKYFVKFMYFTKEPMPDNIVQDVNGFSTKDKKKYEERSIKYLKSEYLKQNEK